jgi:hypothetical protein
VKSTIPTAGSWCRISTRWGETTGSEATKVRTSDGTLGDVAPSPHAESTTGSPVTLIPMSRDDVIRTSNTNPAGTIRVTVCGGVRTADQRGTTSSTQTNGRFGLPVISARRRAF